MGKRHRASGFRSQRLEELICEEVNSLFQDEIVDRRLDGARVTRVELSSDGARARIWFTKRIDSVSQRNEVESALLGATGFVRARLCEALPLKRIPELCFRHDPAASMWLDEKEIV